MMFTRLLLNSGTKIHGSSGYKPISLLYCNINNTGCLSQHRGVASSGKTTGNTHKSASGRNSRFSNKKKYAQYARNGARDTSKDKIKKPQAPAKAKDIFDIVSTNIPSIFTVSGYERDETDPLIRWSKDSNALFNGNTEFLPPSYFNHQLPSHGIPEFAFVGKSNVGKSSLTSALLGSQTTVRISKQPGCTRSVNYFGFLKPKQPTLAGGTAGGGAGHCAYIVDMPGYGFAKNAKGEQTRWQSIVEGYITSRDQGVLRRVFILVDSRHGIKQADVEMMRLLNSGAIPYQIIFTKCDLVDMDTLQHTLTDAFDVIMSKDGIVCIPEVHVISTATGVGLHELKLVMTEIYRQNWAIGGPSYSEEAFSAGDMIVDSQQSR